MQEFWFCEACKSMNRASSPACYRCRAPKALSTMATVRERQPGTVLTPGLDEQDREVAWALMARHQYHPAWRLGYFSAVLLALAGLAALVVLAIDLGIMVTRRSTDPLPVGDERFWLLFVSLIVTGILFLAAIVVHSVFLGLATLNAPALGSGTPRFDPIRAGLWWIESALWAMRAALAFVVPPLLCLFAILLGGVLFGLVGGMVWFVVAYWLFGDPISCLGKPRRLLQDLYERLAVEGSPDSRLVSWWATAWGAARGIDYATAALAYIVVLGLVIVSFVGMFFGFGFEAASPEESRTAATALGYFIVGSQLVFDGIAWYLLIEITIELSKRQRAREEWVLSSAGGVQPWPGGPGGVSAGGPAFGSSTFDTQAYEDPRLAGGSAWRASTGAPPPAAPPGQPSPRGDEAPGSHRR